jgi:hypothetical protein
MCILVNTQYANEVYHRAVGIATAGLRGREETN